MRSPDVSTQDNYISSLFAKENSTQQLSRQFAEELGLARISVSPAEAQVMKTLIKAHGGRLFIEIGTLTGLSAQYIVEALPADGELWTLEKDPRHASKAREVFAQMKLGSKKIHLVEGDAREQLLQLAELGPFDGLFIDGNKAAYYDYLLWAEKNLRRGGLILADNIFLSGAVWGAETAQRFSPKQIDIMRQFNTRLADASLYDSAILTTAEGLFMAVKK